MQPSLIVLGFAVALLFGWRAAWLIPAAAIAWAIAVSEPMGLVIGVANTALGFACGWLIRATANWVRGTPKPIARTVQ